MSTLSHSLRSLFVLLLLAGWLPVQAQTPPSQYEAEYEKRYQRRIQQEVIAGVYIPVDLADAFAQLNRLTDASSRQKYIAIPDSIAARRLFFSLGRWMIVNWGFYEGSRLSHYLKGLGLSHPEDMARFIMVGYHRNLRKVPLDVQPLLAQIIAERKQLWLDQVSEGEVIQEQSRTLDSTQVKRKY